MIDVERHLLRALAARAGGEMTIAAVSTRPWASITFTGSRIVATLALAAAVAERMTAGIGEHEFAIPGHVVADIAITRRAEAAGIVTLELAALIIEDG